LYYYYNVYAAGYLIDEHFLGMETVTLRITITGVIG